MFRRPEQKPISEPSSKSKPKTDAFVQIGQIVGTHGVKGGLKVLPLTDFPSRFEPGQQVWIKGTARKIQRTTWHKGQARIQVEGLTDMSSAELLKWVFLEVPADSRPTMESDEMLVSDLIGMKVVEEDGREIGVVDDVVEAPAQDLLQVGTALIPLVSEFVKDIDPESGTVTVKLIPGMLDVNEAEQDRP